MNSYKSMTITKKFFCGFSPAKMHCEFTYTTNAFQDKSWDLSNSKGYEHSFMSSYFVNKNICGFDLKVLSFRMHYSIIW